MFNPYRKMTNEIWQQCRDEKLPYMVSQTFKRAFATYRKSDPTCVLLTPYKQFAAAAEHSSKQSDDPMAAFLRLDDPQHVEGVERLLDTGSGFIPYWGLIPHEQSLFQRCIRHWEPQIREYLAENTGHHHDSHQPTELKLEQLFGELIVRITYGKKSWMVKLEDIEREGMPLSFPY